MLSDKPELIRDVIRESDLSFLNDEEAGVLFPGDEQFVTTSGKQLFVTRGAIIYLGDHEVAIESVTAEVLDPTGAGTLFADPQLPGSAKAFTRSGRARKPAHWRLK